MFSIGTPSNRIVDHFTYTPGSGNEMENGNEDVQWEFFVIGGRVPWNEAQAICPIYGYLNSLSAIDEEMGYNAPPDSTTRKANTGSTLAIFDEHMKDWLARMVSESNYRLFHYFISLELLIDVRKDLMFFFLCPLYNFSTVQYNMSFWISTDDLLVYVRYQFEYVQFYDISNSLN